MKPISLRLPPDADSLVRELAPLVEEEGGASDIVRRCVIEALPKIAEQLRGPNGSGPQPPPKPREDVQQSGAAIVPLRMADGLRQAKRTLGIAIGGLGLTLTLLSAPNAGAEIPSPTAEDTEAPLHRGKNPEDDIRSAA